MQPASLPVGVSVCGECGVVAPAQGTACDVCHSPLAEARRAAPPLPPEQCWVAVRAGFTCNSCRFLAPLDSLDADGAVECAHCGLRQRFEPQTWVPALEFAHSVADLAGPAPEGRNPHPTIWVGSDNPYANVGVTHTFEHETFEALSLDAAPGHPTCQKCRVPLQVELAGPGACHSRCVHCGERAAFRLADGARALYEPLLAVVSDDHRSDQPKVQLRPDAAGGVTLNCGSCGAPLTVEGKTSLQTCSYCKASCIVPHRSLSRALHAEVEPSVWWLLVRGISPKRNALTFEAEPKQGETRKQALKLLKLGGKARTVGDEPGVYEAPEQPGLHVSQMLFTIALGLLALLIAFVVTRFIPLSF